MGKSLCQGGWIVCVCVCSEISLLCVPLTSHTSDAHICCRLTRTKLADWFTYTHEQTKKNFLNVHTSAELTQHFKGKWREFISMRRHQKRKTDGIEIHSQYCFLMMFVTSCWKQIRCFEDILSKVQVKSTVFICKSICQHPALSLHWLSAFTLPSWIVLVVLRDERAHHHLQRKSVRSTNLYVAVYVLRMAEVVGLVGSWSFKIVFGTYSTFS